MCFYDDDYEWYAEVHDTTTGTSPLASRCYECHRRIEPHQWLTHIFQQEREACSRCDECGDDYDPDQDPATCEHDYGETFECDICESCIKLREAIERVEEEEDCPPHARQPGIGGLWDVMLEHSDATKYAQRAIEMFPELGGDELIRNVLNS